MNFDNLNKSILLNSFLRLILLLVYILILEFIDNVKLLIVPLCLIAIAIIYLERKDMKLNYKLKKVDNKEEESKSCKYITISEIFFLFTLNALSIDGTISLILTITLFVISLVFQNKATQYLSNI